MNPTTSKKTLIPAPASEHHAMLSPSRVRVATQLVSPHFAYIGEGRRQLRFPRGSFEKSLTRPPAAFFRLKFTSLSDPAVSRADSAVVYYQWSARRLMATVVLGASLSPPLSVELRCIDGACPRRAGS